MLLEYSGICQHCANEVKILVNKADLFGRCSECNRRPFNIKQKRGLVYVVNNPMQQGVKIGQTRKSVEERVKQLSSTGVVGKFVPIAIFPSDRPLEDEKKAHQKLKKKNLEREHFDLDPVEAVLGVYRSLNKRKPIFFDEDVKELFFLELEKARIDMKLRLRGKKMK